MRTVFFICLMMCAMVLNAQPKIVFDKYTHDYGPVSSQFLIPAYFTFTNQGDQPLAILIIEKSPNIIAKYKNKFYAPNERGVITVFFDNNKLGYFKEDFRVFTNQSDKPLVLTVKGRNVDILECNSNDNIEDKGFCKIYVVDEVTKQPIKDALIKITQFNELKSEFSTDKEGLTKGKLGQGQFDIQIDADGYQELNKKISVSFSGQVFVYELVPKEEGPGDMIVDIPEEKPREVMDEVLPVDKYAPNNIILLLDVSLSMKNNRKFVLLSEATNQLIDVLRPIDYVSVISYATEPALLATGVTGDQKDTLHAIINSLAVFGVTNGVKGLDMAYKLAAQNHLASGNNQVILATDGKFTSTTDQENELEKLIELNKLNGNILSIVGFGRDEEAVERLKNIAILGGGKYMHVEEEEEISSLLIDEIKEKSFIQK